MKMIPAALETALEESVDFREGLPTNYLSYMGVAHSDKDNKERTNFTKKVNLDFDFFLYLDNNFSFRSKL
jgi:hypothetical protein